MVTFRSCGRNPARFDKFDELLFFAIIPATLLFCTNLAATNLPLMVDMETDTSIYISLPFTVLTDRSMSERQEAAELVSVLICLDADDQIYIREAGAPVSCSCPSAIRSTLIISLPIHSIQKLKQWKKLLCYESSESLVSVTLSHWLRRSVISLCLLPEFIGELKDELQRPLIVKYSDKADSSLQSLKKKLDNSIRTKQHLKLTQSGL